MLMFNRNASFTIQDLHSWICHCITEVELFDYIRLWNCINVWLCCFLNRTKDSYVRNKGDCSVSSASFRADENGAAVSYTHAGIRLKIKLDDSLYSVAVPQETSHYHLFSKVFCEFCHHILSKSHFPSVLPTRILQAFPAFQWLGLSASYVAAGSSSTGTTTATPSWPWARVRATHWSGWQSGPSSVVILQLSRDTVVIRLFLICFRLQVRALLWPSGYSQPLRYQRDEGRPTEQLGDQVMLD